MAVTMHACRGNFRSTFISSGGYEPVAEVLLGQVNFDGYFLEYDSDRAGGFEPLRFLPKGEKQVVLGLITSKSGTLESKDEVKRRIDEAAKFAPLEQFCLSPQCGFASTEEGNILTEDQQWAKMREIVELSPTRSGANRPPSSDRSRAARARSGHSPHYEKITLRRGGEGERSRRFRSPPNTPRRGCRVLRLEAAGRIGKNPPIKSIRAFKGGTHVTNT